MVENLQSVAFLKVLEVVENMGGVLVSVEMTYLEEKMSNGVM